MAADGSVRAGLRHADDDLRALFDALTSGEFANHAAQLLAEAIHLTGAFQLAGYAHVIGTLWPISDEFAVHVTTGFYNPLRDHTSHLNTDNAATALHHTLRTLIAEQDLYTTPWLWAPYIHAGA